MSVVVKTPLIKIEVTEGKKRKLYLVSAKSAHAVETLLGQLDESEEGSIPATELFPNLGDPKKTPGIALRGVRLRLDMTQKEMADKIGVSQGDLSKMEKGERPIGKKLAMRIGKALRIDYRRFL
ncbi:MAG: helix-turn-helix transcriptional regulator [Bdellovibrionales bacterium]|jgi:DNA-binding XRE family transcriptional regulator|nr:helix-turn-helix transcriptional regulator [Bdellovibrionales bacterium]